MPKLPPPPRIAQNRSGFESAEAVRHLAVRAHDLRLDQAVASRARTCAAASRSPRPASGRRRRCRTPRRPARPARRPGSRGRRRPTPRHPGRARAGARGRPGRRSSRARSISMPPSIDDRPAIECPPPRTATGRPRSRAKLTRRHDVGRAAAAHDHRGAALVHRVEGGPHVVIAGVTRREHATPNRGLQLVQRAVDQRNGGSGRRSHEARSVCRFAGVEVDAPCEWRRMCARGGPIAARSRRRARWESLGRKARRDGRRTRAWVASRKRPDRSARARRSRSGELGLARAAGELPDQLAAGAHVELAEDAAQVEVDRLRAEEERGADLLVRLALGDVQRDLQLLRRQLVALARLAPAEPLARSRAARRRARSAHGRGAERFEGRRAPHAAGRARRSGGRRGAGARRSRAGSARGRRRRAGRADSSASPKCASKSSSAASSPGTARGDGVVRSPGPHARETPLRRRPRARRG